MKINFKPIIAGILYGLILGMALCAITYLSGVKAQTTKGTKFVEVGTSSSDMRVNPTGFQFYIAEGGKDWGLTTGATVGYFVADGLAVKVGFGFSTQKHWQYSYNFNSYGVSAGVEAYVAKKFPVELRYSASFRDAYYDAHFLTLKIGYAFKLTDNVMVSPNIYADHSLNDNYKSGAGVGVQMSYNFKNWK